MGSDRERITLIFDGAHWKSEDPNITFKAGTKITAEIDLSLVNDKPLQRNLKVKIFGDGEELLVALKRPSIGKLPDDIQNIFYDTNGSDFCPQTDLPQRFNLNNYSFVLLKLEQASSDRLLGSYDPELGTGWFELAQFKKGKIHCSSIKPPEGFEFQIEPKSLNHAYTQLSELIEPERLSHTGNIYDLIFYKETNDKWYPLNKFRHPKESDSGDMRVSCLWETIGQLKN